MRKGGVVDCPIKLFRKISILRCEAKIMIGIIMKLDWHLMQVSIHHNSEITEIQFVEYYKPYLKRN